MRINHNIPALRALHQLSMNNSKLDKTLERLSSGLRINHSSDDAAGLAITQKMDTQIRGLEQAKRNTMDGISLIQTAEGALNEVHAMLQRIRELSIQVANGTYDEKDRKAVTSEVNALKDEIDRISNNIEFNERKLLNGEIDRRAFPEDESVAKIVSLSDTVNPGNYTLNIIQDASKATVNGGTITHMGSTVGDDGIININGEEVKIEANDTPDMVFKKLSDLSEKVGIDLVSYSDITYKTPAKFQFNGSMALKFESKQYGSDYKLSINGDTSLLSRLGLSQQNVKGTDVEASLNMKHSDFSTTASISTTGNIVTVTDKNGFEIRFEAQMNTVANNSKYNEAFIAGVTAGTTSASPLTAEKATKATEAFMNALAIGKTVNEAKNEAKLASNATNDTPINAIANAVLVKAKAKANSELSSSDGIIETHLGKSDNEIIDEIMKLSSNPTRQDAEKALAAFKGSISNQTNVEVLDAGPLDLQIGANEGQFMEVRIPSISPKALGIDTINLSSSDGCQLAIGIVDEAVSKVSSIRAKLGAYQNRLEHTVNNLGVASENMTESMSRIQDADMAYEMAQYTQKNIISQAGTSMLAQANQRPQQILQLLQG